VYNLGDFAFGRGVTNKYVQDIAFRLQGTIHLINGNHEKLAHQISQRFASIQDYKEIEVEGQRIVLFHYGLRTWHHDTRGVWHLYGHSHGGLEPYGKSLDIGIDKWNFTPVSFAQLKETMDKRPIAKHPTFQNYKPGDNE
jgi:calcineurin-like phosphoesterase family protein